MCDLTICYASWRIRNASIERSRIDKKRIGVSFLQHWLRGGLVVVVVHHRTQRTLIFFSVARSVGVRNWLGSVLLRQSVFFSLQSASRHISISTPAQTEHDPLSREDTTIVAFLFFCFFFARETKITKIRATESRFGIIIRLSSEDRVPPAVIEIC